MGAERPDDDARTAGRDDAPAFAGMTAGAYPGLVPGAATASVDPLVRLERLADLHARGALTDDEFAALKRRLLDAV